MLPERLAPIARGLAGLVGRLPVPMPVPAPSLPVQFIHEEDVGQAFLLCIVGAGPPGAYNIAGEGVLTVPEIARELGLTPVPVPAGLVKAGAWAVASMPFAPLASGWAEAITHPPVMDVSKAKRELGWRPRHTGLEALRATLPGT